MKDIGHEETEKILSQLEKEIAAEYRIAEREVQEKLEKYMEAYQRKNAQKLRMVKDGRMTQQEYQRWLTGQLAIGDRWKDMKDVLAEDFTHASQIARSITFGHMPEVYALNHNYATFQVESTSLVDTSYVMYDKHTVERLFRGGKFYHEPGRKLTEQINAGKTKAWNKRQIQSVMIQGILQGESIDKIAKRIATTVGEKNRRSDVRNARTMTTGVQNAGRVDSYKRAESMGIELLQEWLAVMDNRTRHEHRILDGEKVPVGTPFKVQGYEIEYPGDPSAEGFLIYNCRCTLIPALKGFDKTKPHTTNPALGDMTYEEWKAGRKRPAKPAPAPLPQKKVPAQQKKPQKQPQAQQKPYKFAKDFDRMKHFLNRECENEGIDNIPVMKLDKKLSNQEIIDRLAGGDRTQGSCASLTYAYIGNKMGLDIHDFRGGNSQDFFSYTWVTELIDKDCAKNRQELSAIREASGFAQILKGLNVKLNKEYRMSAGRHAAIVRKTKTGWEYLELQSEQKKGWRPFDEGSRTMEDTLWRRFGCRKTEKKDRQGNVILSTMSLTEVDSYVKNDEFVDLLGFINTPKNKQKKGASGYAK